MRLLFPAAIAAALAASPAFSTTVTKIDFSGFTDNQEITSILFPGLSVSISSFASNQNGVPDSPANPFDVVAFDTNRTASPERDPDLLYPFDGDNSTRTGNGPFGNIAVIRELDGTDGDKDTSEGPANDRRNELPGTIRFQFSEDISFLSVDAFDFGDTGDIRIFLDSVRVQHLNSASNGLSGDNKMETFLPDGPYLGSTLDFVFRSSGGIDNIEFEYDPSRSTIGVIPLPAGAWLLLSGFGLVAGAKRIRKRSS